MHEIQETKPHRLVISFKNVFAFFCALIVILNSGYYRSTANDSYVPLVILMCFAAFGFFINFSKLFKQKINSILLVLVLGIVLSILVNFSTANALSGFRVLVTMICSYIVVCTVSLNDFTKYFTLQIKIVIVLALLLNLLLLAGVSNFPTISNYYDLFIVTNRVSNGRAFGVFWEPGVFASMIIISMLFEYYIAKKKITVLGMVLYIVGMLSTKSTAGYLLLFVVLFGLIWQKIFNSNYKKRPLFIVLFLTLIVCAVVFYESLFEFLFKLNPTVFGKLLETDSDTTSTRINGPLINLQVFAQRPLFGYGFTGAAAEVANEVLNGTFDNVVAQTSTSTQIMASIGILGAMYSLGFILPIFQKKKLPNLMFELKVIVAACMLMIVNKEPHIFIVATWVVLFYIQGCTENVLDE